MRTDAMNTIQPWVTYCLQRLAVVLLIGAAASCNLHAEEKYPSRALKIVVPYAAGGPGDILARAFSGALSEELAQPVIVDNRPGADGATGTEQAARAAPDGYTILQLASTQIINMVLKDKDKIRYDLLRDFLPVVRTVQAAMVLVVPRTSAAHSVSELVALAKSRPNGLVFGSGATGSVGHLSAEMFKRSTGISALHVPYKGTGAALPDLIAGRLDFFFMTQFEAVGAVKGGQLRALAITSAQRVPVFPDIPTMSELGFTGLEARVSYGYLVPLNTPAPVVQRIHDAVLKVMATPNVQRSLQTLGATPNPGGPEEMSATIKSELTTWGRVIKAANITAEQ